MSCRRMAGIVSRHMACVNSNNTMLQISVHTCQQVDEVMLTTSSCEAVAPAAISPFRYFTAVAFPAQHLVAQSSMAATPTAIVLACMYNHNILAQYTAIKGITPSQKNPLFAKPRLLCRRSRGLAVGADADSLRSHRTRSHRTRLKEGVNSGNISLSIRTSVAPALPRLHILLQMYVSRQQRSSQSSLAVGRRRREASSRQPAASD